MTNSRAFFCGKFAGIAAGLYDFPFDRQVCLQPRPVPVSPLGMQNASVKKNFCAFWGFGACAKLALAASDIVKGIAKRKLYCNDFMGSRVRNNYIKQSSSFI
jgi:hypothetical protein